MINTALPRRYGFLLGFFAVVVLLIPYTRGMAAVNFASAVNYSVTGGPMGIVTADFDGDGDSDVAVTLTSGANIAVFLNNGSGAFGLASYYAVGDTPVRLAVGDFDGSNGVDIAVANYTSNNVSVLLNDGSGTFASAVNYTVGTQAHSIAAANLDGDSDIDLVVTNAGSDNVSVLLNNGSGTFAAATNYGVGSVPNGMFLADFDGDSDNDIAAANSNDGTLSILKNNGSGSFGTATDYEYDATNTTVPTIYGINLDGDSDIDIAVANNDGDTVDVMLNNGSAAFTLSAQYATGAETYSVFAADFDSDGDNDLAVTSMTNDSVSVLLNNGSGIFAAATNFTVGDNPEGIYGADFDGDGDVDLVTANAWDSSISVLLNALLTAGGNPWRPLTFEEQRRRIAARLAPNAPSDMRVVPLPCRNETCLAEIVFTYNPSEFHRGYSTVFAFQDDGGRVIGQMSVFPQNGKEYRMTARDLKSNQAFFGKLCAEVGVLQSCGSASGFAHIVLPPDAIKMRVVAIDVVKKIHRVSFAIFPLPMNYAVGATGMAVLMERKVNGAKERVAERVYRFTPFEQLLHEALPAGRYEITFIPRNADGRDGEAITKEVVLNGDESESRDVKSAKTITGKIDISGEVERITQRLGDLFNQLKALLDIRFRPKK